MTKREESENINLFDDDLLDLPLRAPAAAPERREVGVEVAGPLEFLPALDAEQSAEPTASQTSEGLDSGSPAEADLLANLDLFDATALPAAEAGANLSRGSDAERAVFGDVPPDSKGGYLRTESALSEVKVGAGSGSSVTAVALRSTVFHRLLAGALDSALHVGVALFVFLMVVGEATPADRQLFPGFVAFLVVFSFLYFVISLLAWGRTPGMVWAGLESCDKDGQGLTFGQAVMRWLGVLMTVLLAGLPFLLTLLGRSAADILSGTVTRETGGG